MSRPGRKTSILLRSFYGAMVATVIQGEVSIDKGVGQLEERVRTWSSSIKTILVFIVDWLTGLRPLR